MRQSDAGFTIVELLIAAVVIAIMFFGIYGVYSYGFSVFLKTSELNRAAALAENLKEEILSKPLVYNPPKNEPESGRRINFNSVYDYAGYEASPPVDITGTPYGNHGGYSVKVNIKNVKPDRYNNIVRAPAYSAYADITITVEKNNKKLIELPFIVTE